jgi:hypothetical protein
VKDEIHPRQRREHRRTHEPVRIGDEPYEPHRFASVLATPS